jgi:hypothetical protein
LLVGVAFLIDAYVRGKPSCSQSVFQS